MPDQRPAASTSSLAGPDRVTGQPQNSAPLAPVGFDLRLLESFVTLASELHFGRAAQKLACATPALSQQIRRLETQLGCALFTRDSRKVELTAAGTAFLAHARNSVAAAFDAWEAALASTHAAGGRLSLSVNGDALDHARELLRAFAATHPDVLLDVTLQFDEESRVSLARHAVDASILWSDNRPPRGFESTSALLATPGAGIAMRTSHALAPNADVSLDRLDGQRLVMFPRERATELYDRVIRHVGGASRFSSIHHIKPFGHGVAPDILGALDNDSVAPLPRWRALEHAPQGFVCKPLVPSLSMALWLVWTGPATPPTRALAAFAKSRDTRANVRSRSERRRCGQGSGEMVESVG